MNRLDPKDEAQHSGSRVRRIIAGTVAVGMLSLIPGGVAVAHNTVKTTHEEPGFTFR